MKHGHIINIAVVVLAAASTAAIAQDHQVALVSDFVNVSKDKHTIVVQAATDGVAAELKKRDVYEVLSRREVEKTAYNRGLRAPYTAEDYVQIAKDLGATLIVSGEVRDFATAARAGQREAELGLVVRVKEAESGDLINGAAVRASVSAPGAEKSEGELGIDAASMAATRAVARIEGYRPVTGTIMGSVGGGALMLNRGVSHGVKPKQEFIVLRDGRRVGRVQAQRPSSSYTELTVLENSGGIQPQDRVLALFPEPKLGR